MLFKKKWNNIMLWFLMKKGRLNCVIVCRKSVLFMSNSCFNLGNLKKNLNNSKSVSNVIRNLLRWLMNNVRYLIVGYNLMRLLDSVMVRSFGVLFRGLFCNDLFYWLIIILIDLMVVIILLKKMVLILNWRL